MGTVDLPLEESGCCFRLHGPPKLCWMINTGCNLRCPHCAVFENPFVGSFAGLRRREDIDPVLDFIAQRGIRKVVVSGGEPTLSPWLQPALAALHEASIDFSLSTNATTLTAQRTRALASLGLRKATVSLDGATAGTHDQLRGRGAWLRAHRGIELLIDASVEVSVGVFLRDAAAKEAGALADDCARIGVDRLSFFRPIPRGRYTSNRAALPSTVSTYALLNATAPARAEGLRVTVHTPRCESSDCPSGTHIYGAIGRSPFEHCVYKHAQTPRFHAESMLL